jgi:hypothetical protein
MTNILNTLYATALKSVNAFVIEIRDSFSGRINSAEMLIFALLSIFLLLAILEVPLGCYLLRTVHVEEGLFLRLPNHTSRKHQKDANNFITKIQVRSHISI